jgi:hypothetical protein
MQAVVGLGGSAGSIGALQTFFSKMTGNSGLAFVVVLHLFAPLREYFSGFAAEMDANAGNPSLRADKR